MPESGTMEILMLALILLVFILPSVLMMRAQKKRQAEVSEMQASLEPGDRIINVAGFHATVVANNGETLVVELAPGFEVTMEAAGVMKRVAPAVAPEI